MSTFTFNNTEFKTVNHGGRVEIYFPCDGLEEFICYADELMSGTFFNRKFGNLDNIVTRENGFEKEFYFNSGGQEQFMFYDIDQREFFYAALNA